MTLAAGVTHGASMAAISHHYDVDGNFYALWLEQTRCYSCALFDGPGESLEQAQLNKLDYIASEAGARGAARVLDVGCGWGGLLDRLKHVYGVSATTGLTLSAEQQKYIHQRYANQHDVRLESWQDHRPVAPYDAIVSVGAFEHFARPGLSREARLHGYRAFFARCHGWMVPGGGVCLQTICYDLADRSELPPFFRDWVFPESDLPRPEEVLAASDGLFHLVRMRNDADHYAQTLAHWSRRLRQNSAEAKALVGDETFDKFMKYLALSRVSFHTRRTGLLRITLRRAAQPATARAGAEGGTSWKS